MRGPDSSPGPGSSAGFGFLPAADRPTAPWLRSASDSGSDAGSDAGRLASVGQVAGFRFSRSGHGGVAGSTAGGRSRRATRSPPPARSPSLFPPPPRPPRPPPPHPRPPPPP